MTSIGIARDLKCKETLERNNTARFATDGCDYHRSFEKPLVHGIVSGLRRASVWSKTRRMDPATIRSGFFSVCVFATFLAIGLLRVEPCRAQTGNPDKTDTQSQPSSKDDKSNGKDDKSAAPHTTRLKIVVTNSEDKPVGNASVYVRFNEAGGFLHHDKLAEMSFKTNGDGTVKVPSVPAGKILIQVIAKGLHTFGKWYDIQEDAATIDIKLDPPPHWY